MYKSFTVVYEGGNLYRASEVLGVSRAAISQNIKELERQLSVVLFSSTNKGLFPTGEATNLYQNLKGAISSIVNTENDFQSFNTSSAATVKIGLSSNIAEVLVADYLIQFCVKYPNVKLEFYKQNMNYMLENGKLDLIINIDQYLNSDAFDVRKIMTGNLVFFAARDFLVKHNLSQNITLDALLELSIITYNENWNDFVRQHSIASEPKVIKTQSSELNYYLAKRSLGVGLHCRELLEMINDKDIVMLNIENIKLETVDIIYAFNKNLSRPAKAFVNGLVDFCKTK